MTTSQIPVLYHRGFFDYFSRNAQTRKFGSNFQRLETKIAKTGWRDALLIEGFVNIFEIAVETTPENKDYKNCSYLADKKEVGQLLERFGCQDAAELVGRQVNAYYIDKELYAVEPVEREM